MASNINSVVITGRVTQDVELRHTPSGKPVARLRIANNQSRKVDDAWVDEASFLTVIAWEGLGERAAAKMQVGDFVTVNGRIKQRQYQAQDGTNREAVEIIAFAIEGDWMFRKAEQAQQPQQQQPPQQQAQTTAPPPQQQAAATTPSADDDIPF